MTNPSVLMVSLFVAGAVCTVLSYVVGYLTDRESALSLSLLTFFAFLLLISGFWLYTESRLSNAGMPLNMTLAEQPTHTSSAVEVGSVPRRYDKANAAVNMTKPPDRLPRPGQRLETDILIDRPPVMPFTGKHLLTSTLQGRGRVAQPGPPGGLKTRVIWGLVAVMAGIAGVGAFIGSSLFGKTRGAIAVPALWISFCALFFMGHFMAGWIGILTITLPIMLVFWATMVILAGWFALPIKRGEEGQQRWQAIGSVFTFTIGTNRPYYVLGERDLIERASSEMDETTRFEWEESEERKPIQRASGDVSRRLFAGPGIVLTSADHIAILSDGINFTGVAGPGLSFTRGFENIQETFDLRPQLRSFPVEARTKDGITINVLTFTPFQIARGDQKPELGKHFPFHRRAAFRAAHAEIVEVSREGSGAEEIESQEKKGWDTLVPLAAKRIMKSILGEYNFDELCAPHQPQRDPRNEIRDRFLRELREAVEPWGLQVIGGGFSNLLPADDSALETRIESWKAQWAEELMTRLVEGEADALRMEAEARARAHAQLVYQISTRFADEEIYEGNISANLIVMRFMDAIEEMIGDQLVRRALPGEVVKTLNYLHDVIEGRDNAENKADESAQSGAKR